MKRYATQIAAIDNHFNKDLTGFIMEFIEHPITKWAKHNFSLVLNEMMYLEIELPNIRSKIPLKVVKTYSEDFLYELLSLVKHEDKCKKCRKYKRAIFFYSPNTESLREGKSKKFNTCSACRYNEQHKRLISRVDRELLYFKINSYKTRDMKIPYKQGAYVMNYLKSVKSIIFIYDMDYDYKKKNIRIIFVNPNNLCFGTISP